MGTGKAVLAGVTALASLKSLSDIVAGGDPGLLHLGAAISAAFYGLSEDRLGAGLSVYCAIEATKKFVEHNDPVWWIVGTTFFAMIYGLSDNTTVRIKIVKEHMPSWY